MSNSQSTLNHDVLFFVYRARFYFPNILFRIITSLTFGLKSATHFSCVLVIYCCITNCTQISRLRAVILPLMELVGQEFRQGIAGTACVCSVMSGAIAGRAKGWNRTGIPWGLRHFQARWLMLTAGWGPSLGFLTTWWLCPKSKNGGEKQREAERGRGRGEAYTVISYPL